MPSENSPHSYDQEDITEEHSLDELAKGLADGTMSRSRALKLAAGALLGGTLLALFPGPASAEIEGNVGGGGGGRRRRRRRRRRRGSGGSGGIGGGGCPPDTTLVNGECCPNERACGGVCCAPGQGCLPGDPPFCD